MLPIYLHLHFKKCSVTFHVRDVSNNKPHFWLNSSTRIKFLQNNVINQENFTFNKQPSFQHNAPLSNPKIFYSILYNLHNLYYLRLKVFQIYTTNPSKLTKLIPKKKKKEKTSNHFYSNQQTFPILSIHQNRNDQANPLSLGHKLAVIYTGGEKTIVFHRSG